MNHITLKVRIGDTIESDLTKYGDRVVSTDDTHAYGHEGIYRLFDLIENPRAPYSENLLADEHNYFIYTGRATRTDWAKW